MKKYTKVLVALVVVVLVSSVGFTTAFGRGSYTRTTTPVITLAPVGQVLGESTESTSSFITRLVSMNIISPSMVPFINLLISLGIIK